MPKKNNILDADDHSGPRTCPECGFQFPFQLLIKRFVLKYGFPKWTCPNCRELIKYNYFKANLIGAIVFFVCVFACLGLKTKFGWDLPIFIFVIPYFIIVLMLLNLDGFEKYEA